MDILEFLEHHGVKGQKWGIRKDGSTASSKITTSRLSRKSKDVTVRQKPGQFVRTTGGKRQGASGDAVATAATRQFAKRSTTDALTTQQLKDAVNRMNMEQQYHALVKKTNRKSRRQKLAASLFKQHGATLIKVLAPVPTPG